LLTLSAEEANGPNLSIDSRFAIPESGWYLLDYPRGETMRSIVFRLALISFFSCFRILVGESTDMNPCPHDGPPYLVPYAAWVGTPRSTTITEGEVPVADVSSYVHVEAFPFGTLFTAETSVTGSRQSFSRVSRRYGPDASIKFGFKNENGDVIIPAQFRAVRRFCEGKAPVQIGDLWAYIIKSGDIKLPAQYTEAREFFEDRAPVRLGTQWGMINPAGKQLCEKRYFDISPSNAGRSSVEVLDEWGRGSFGFVDEDCRAINNELYSEVGPFGVEGGEGEPLARVRRNGLLGLIDKQGKVSVPLAYDSIGPFQDFGNRDKEPLAIATRLKKMGLITRKGKLIAPVEYSMISNPVFSPAFGKKIISVMKEDRKGILDGDGSTLIPVVFKELGTFSVTGYARARGEGNWGYLNTKGGWATLQDFNVAGDVRFGVSVVRLNNFWGFVDFSTTSVRWLIAPSYAFATDFISIDEGRPDDLFNRELATWTTPPYEGRPWDTYVESFNFPVAHKALATIVDSCSFYRSSSSAIGLKMNLKYIDLSGQSVHSSQRNYERVATIYLSYNQSVNDHTLAFAAQWPTCTGFREAYGGPL
jgi:WG containing repeat